MKRNLRIRQKLQLSILTASVALYVFVIAFISYKTRVISVDDAKRITDIEADKYAGMVQNKLDKDILIPRTLAHSFLKYYELPEEQWKQNFADMYESVLRQNPHIEAVWDSWELSNLAEDYDKTFGRYTMTYYREEGKILGQSALKSLEGDSKEYGRLKNLGILGFESIEDPYQFTYGTEITGQGLWMTSLVSPLIEGGEYIGLVGIDIILNNFQEMIDTISVFEGSSSYLVSNNGAFISNPDVKKIGGLFKEIHPRFDEEFKISKNIETGESFSFIRREDGKRIYYTFCPIKVGNTNTPWSLYMRVPLNSVLNNANKSLRVSIITGVIGLILLWGLIWWVSGRITKPLERITKRIKRVAEGEARENMIKNDTGGDEITEMSQALDKSIDGLLKKAEFAETIINGNLGAHLDLLSEKDHLGKTLLKMQTSLKHASDEEQERAKENLDRKWFNEGLNLFNSIIHQQHLSIEELSHQLIKEIISYVEALQGGIFIYNADEENEKHLEMVAAFAYNRKKHIQKYVDAEDGLLGTCIKERQTIYLKELPQSYVEITSGLGQMNPNSLLLVPMMVEDKVFGVIEIASIKEFSSNQIELIEKIGESIAASLSSVKSNERTMLLLEKSQQQAEEMAAQEEELRQNLEELQTTQEEASRREVELNSVLKALNKNLFVMEFDIEGRVIRSNKKYQELFLLTNDTIHAKHYRDLFPNESFTHLWERLMDNRMVHKEAKLTLHDKTYYFNESFSPVSGSDLRVQKVLLTAVEVTEYKSNEKQFIQQKAELKSLQKEFADLESESKKLQEKVIEQQAEIDRLKDGK